MAMASSGDGGVGEEEANQLAEQLSKTLKDGERILAPTRRPDGTLRKPIRIRAGYVPQDEVAIYKSKGALWKKEMQSMQEVPPGFASSFDPDVDAKPKTKSAKRNERKKEKRQQAALDKGKNSDKNEDSSEDACHELEPVESVVSQMNDLAISGNSAVVTPSSDSTECSTPSDPIPDIDKKIRALKKKIRLSEAQQQKTTQQDMKPEQQEKMAKLEGWLKELKILEDRKAELLTS